ncbi:Uncharacterized protein OBRU01_01688, partial [Operophtera brumata]
MPACHLETPSGEGGGRPSSRRSGRRSKLPNRPTDIRISVHACWLCSYRGIVSRLR